MLNFSLIKNFDLLTVGIAIVASMLLAFVIYFQNRKSITSKLFLLFTVTSSAWGAVNYLSYKSMNPVVILWLSRLVLLFAVLQAFSFFLLSSIFPEENYTFPKWLRNYLTPLVIFASLFTLSPWVFQKVSLVSATGVSILTPGPGIILFGIVAAGLVVGGLTYLVRRILKSEGQKKMQLRYFMWGTVLMFLAIISFNFILPAAFDLTQFIPLGALFILPFVFFTGYAILKHGLLNIKILSTEFLVFALIVVNFFEIISANNIYDLIFKVLVLFVLLWVGILLIRSVLNEVKQREELQKLSKELELANLRLQKVDEAKTEFLSVASHQLRTPLTAIKGYSSMLLEGDYGPVEKAQKDTVQIIFDSAQRLATLVGELLDLSRIESGRMEFDFAPVNLCQTIESVITEVSPKAKARGLYVYFDNVNRSCPEIRADVEKLRQVVINLIDNAVKYTVTGGVTVQLMQTDETLQLAVKDTGIGVDPAEKAKLFEKFFRTQGANELTREGSGLGIYVVKKIVESHGGKIWFESEGVGRGTTFYVTFPIPKGKILRERVKIESLDAF
jgi:signal transduction histidine kinase